MLLKIFLKVILLSSIGLTQVSIDSSPKSFSLNESINIISEELAPFNIDTLIEEDEINNRSDIRKPYRFANPISVNFNMNNSGEWITLEDGSLLWTLKVKSPGAFSLNVIYDKFNLPEGAEFFVYSANQDMVLGAFTSLNHKPHGGFSTAPVVGDEIIFEYNEPFNSNFRGEISIETISHDYKNIFFNESRGYGDSGSCNNNVACSEALEWQDEIRSVAMILTSGGSRICTGSLVNNASQDLTPYFLTANHCLGGNNSWIFMFNYESPSCANQNGPTNMTLSGSSLLANSSSSDVALLLLNESPPENYNVHFAGWDVSGNTPSIPVGIHHPSGDIKKISFDYDNASNSGNYWDVDSWDDGTTEPGSSGSPLFDGQTHRIIGQLYGGVASCTNFGYDTYGKTSVSWNLGLSEYLDPNNLGLNFIDGIDAIDLPEPLLSYSDIDLLYEISNGESNSSSFSLTNIGELESLLTYSINVNQFQNPLGGPDFSKNYDWIDISNIGTLYNFPTNDDAGELVDIPFDFPFYDNSYNQCFINPNGWIGFESDNNSWDNTTIPSTQAPRSAIFGFWDDLNPINDACNSCFGEVYYHANDDRLVVWFNDVAHWPTYFNDSIYNFQIVLFPNGKIKFNYSSMVGNSSSATIGIQNSLGNSSLMMSFNSQYVQNNLSTIISKAPSWIGINNIGNYSISGEIIQGSSESVNLVLENNQLTEEIYSAYLNINSNGSEPISLPVELINLNNMLLGDLNDDSTINISDVVLAVNLVLSSNYNFLADINSDNTVNVSDIILLINLILQN